MAKEETKKTEAKKTPEIPKKEAKGTTEKVHKTMPDIPTKVVGEKKEKVAKPKKTGVKYTLLKNFDASGSEKMPLQCRQILDILAKGKNQVMSKDELLEGMKPVIQTRQPLERILAFYQPRLLSGKYISMEAIMEVPAAKE